MEKDSLLLRVLLEENQSDTDEETDFSTDSSSDSSDEIVSKVIIFAMFKGKRCCITRYVEEIIPKYSEKEFVTHFRVSSNLFQRLVDKFSTSETYLNLEPGKTFSPKVHLALFLWFAGHEACSFRDLADRFNLALGTVSFIIRRVTFFISNLTESTIKWPSEEKKIQTAQWMKTKTGMFGVIGVIDGTHIRIDPPSRGRDDYIDRKNVTSICLQGICDEQKKFIDIFVGYPGSVHDNRVYDNSTVKPNLPSLCGDYFLIGDSAYACSKYMITPYRDNGRLTSQQKFFNRKLSSGRIVIEHSFGILKQRFRQLYYCKLRNMKKICHFVRACVVLHNLCNQEEIEFEEFATTTEDNFQENHGTEQEEAQEHRNRLCEEVWRSFN